MIEITRKVKPNLKTNKNIRMENNSMSFESWFDIMCDEVRALGWDGSVDEDSARMDYEMDKSPEQAARELYDELTS